LLRQDNESPRISFSAPAAGGTVTLLIRCLRTNRLGIGSGFKVSITHMHIFAFAVSFLGFRAAINQPKGMDMTGYVSENCETDVDQEIAPAAGDKKRRGRREEDSDDDEADV